MPLLKNKFSYFFFNFGQSGQRKEKKGKEERKREEKREKEGKKKEERGKEEGEMLLVLWNITTLNNGPSEARPTFEMLIFF